MIHVRCIANYRVSAFLYRYRIDVLGWPEDKARADLDAVWRPKGVWKTLVDQPPRSPRQSAWVRFPSPREGEGDFGGAQRTPA